MPHTAQVIHRKKMLRRGFSTREPACSVTVQIPTHNPHNLSFHSLSMYRFLCQSFKKNQQLKQEPCTSNPQVFCFLQIICPHHSCAEAVTTANIYEVTWTLLVHLLTQSQDIDETTELSGITEAGTKLFNKRVFTVSAGKQTF